jgi:hypothetical protein
MFGWVAPGISLDDHVVARFERVASHVLLGQLRPAPPLDRPDRRWTALRIRGFDLYELVRIPVQKLGQGAFNRYFLVHKVRRCEGMMSVNRRPGYENDCNYQDQECAFHNPPSQLAVLERTRSPGYYREVQPINVKSV